MTKSYTAAWRRSSGLSRVATSVVVLPMSILISGLALCAGSRVAGETKNFYLPDATASKVVSVATSGEAQGEIFVLTEAVAVKETGPKATVKKFGEVYAFSPNFISVRRDQPIRLTFWNLQPDDEHDFMLADPHGNVLMHMKLAPLSKNSWVFTFHQDGIFPFYCAVHQPEMNGQILVLPPSGER